VLRRDAHRFKLAKLRYPLFVPRAAYLVSDLLFVSKIRETASRLGVELVSARDGAALAAAGAVLVIVDLRRPDAMAALDALASATCTKVGFVDHEREDIMDAARSRGCQALAKGKFASELPKLFAALV
jgi:hypothetical protein